MMYPWALRNYSELKVSLERIDEFLAAEDMESQPQLTNNPSSAAASKYAANDAADANGHASSGAVELNDAMLFWSKPTDDDLVAAEAAALARAADTAPSDAAANDGDNGKGGSATSPKPAEGDAESKASGSDDEEEEGPVLPVLSGVSFRVNAGELCAVVGPVGCGKSSLASGMLGELFVAKGTLQVTGSVAYVAQTSWIQHLTLQGTRFTGHARVLRLS